MTEPRYEDLELRSEDEPTKRVTASMNTVLCSALLYGLCMPMAALGFEDAALRIAGYWVPRLVLIKLDDGPWRFMSPSDEEG